MPSDWLAVHLDLKRVRTTMWWTFVVVLADRLDPVTVAAHVHARLVPLDRPGVVAHVRDPNPVVITHLRSSPWRKRPATVTESARFDAPTGAGFGQPPV
jgi:hypothetical protein